MRDVFTKTYAFVSFGNKSRMFLLCRNQVLMVNVRIIEEGWMAGIMLPQSAVQRAYKFNSMMKLWENMSYFISYAFEGRHFRHKRLQIVLPFLFELFKSFDDVLFFKFFTVQ